MKTPESIPSTDQDGLQIEHRIQSLVDDHLDSSARRELLGHIDSQHPEYWRYTALAFVEQQFIREALAEQNPAIHVLPLESAKTSNQTPPARYSGAQWAVAACLAFSLLAGGWWMGGGNKNLAAQSHSVAERANGNHSTPESAPTTTSSATLPQALAMNVPIFDATRDEQAALEQLQSSVQSLRKAENILHQRGYNTSTNTQFLTADLKDGRRLVIPVNHIVFQQQAEPSNTTQPQL